MRFGALAHLCVLGLATILATPATRGGCPPLSGGTDTFPSTAKLVLDDSGVGQPFVVRLSSAGHPDAIVQRTAQAGATIATQLLQMELSGYHPRVGTITLRQSPTRPSLGQIENIELDGGCQLAGGDASFDLFFEIDMGNAAETWDHAVAYRVETRISGLPQPDTMFEVGSVQAIDLLDQATAQQRGQLLYALHRFDPAFPPAGQDCFDSLLTADVHLFGPGSTSNLIGFGPAAIERATPVPGGVCSNDGNPCTTNAQCPFQTCLKGRVDTEIVDLGLGGFDLVLGDWQMSVLPDQGTSDCCMVHAEPGCSDSACETLICSLDSFCCSDTWDDLCAGLADNEPLCNENCLDPDAAPTLGTVRSVSVERTYPADSNFNLFVRLDADMQGSFHNQAPIPLQTPSPVTHLPPDPNTEYRYAGTPVALFDTTEALAGEISNIVQTLQPPSDCQPPAGAAEDCFDSLVRLEWTLTPCPTETLLLDGALRLMRDDPTDGGGLGQDVVDAVVAGGSFDVVSACNGPVTLRLAAASLGGVSSLTPEEFFPADSTHSVQVEILAGGQTLTSAPLNLSTSVNTLPFEAGEAHLGPGTIVDLLDATATKVGEIVQMTHEIQAPILCSTEFRSAIRFPGPTKADLDLGIPLVVGGADYDFVRGSLSALHAGQGSFGSAVCKETDVEPAVSDGDTPPVNDGFYYVSRDGVGAFNGTWNGPGGAQTGNRDPLLPSCE